MSDGSEKSDGTEKVAKSAPVGHSSVLPRTIKIIIVIVYLVQEHSFGHSSGHSSVLPRTIIIIIIILYQVQNIRPVGAKMPFSLVDNQSAHQQCNVHISGSTGKSPSPWC